MTRFNRRSTALALALAWPVTAMGAAINADFNGVRNGDGSITQPGPTYVGPGAAGGGTVWNGVLADSRDPSGGPDNDALFFGAENLVDAEGNSTTVGFTMGPVAAGNQGAAPGSDPTLFENLIWDWVLVGYFTEYTGRADFTISGLGSAPTVDLYWYSRGDFPGGYTIGNEVPAAFAGSGRFNGGNTIFYDEVPVSEGAIVGDFHEVSLLGLVSGFTIVVPDPGPYVKSTAPSGVGVRPDAPIVVEIWDHVTQVNPVAVQVFLNNAPLTPVTTQRVPADAKFWTVTASPPSGFKEGATNTVRVTFADTASPPVVRSVEFSFVVMLSAEGHRVINLDLDGWRGAETTAVTYVGIGAAGGGTVFNALAADSTWGDDNLTVSGAGLLDSIGETTTVSFTLAPVAGEKLSTSADPAAKDSLFADFVAVGYEGQFTGTSDFTIAGLGAVPTVDLYFYFREDPLSDGRFAGSTYTIAGVDPAPFTAHGIFNDGNTVYLKNVPVVNGQVSGTFTGQVGAGGEGSAAGAMSGLSLQKPLPQPYVRRALPKGDYVQPDAAGLIELQDYVTVVDTNSILLAINGQSVTPSITKPAGSTVTTVAYTPPKGWTQETINTMRIVFADQATPPLRQTNEFSFFVISPLKASRIVNVDINGVGHSTLPLGPTYDGSGAAGGGPVFNSVVARSRQEDGTDNDSLTIGGANLLDSAGGPTAFTFTMNPVGGGNSGAVGGETSEKWSALNHDWAIIGYVGGGYNCAPAADFTISGLGTAPVANLYFYFREDPREGGRFGSGAYDIPGVTRKPTPPRGLFSDYNTSFYENVPVSGGTITGRWRMTSVLALLTGLTIELPLPHAFVVSYAPEGPGVMPADPIRIELSDFDPVQVDPTTIQLAVNGLTVTPTIDKPAGSKITTVTYVPATGWPQGNVNHVQLVFGDTAAPPLLQTKEFSFEVIELAHAKKVVNIDINGSRNGDGGVPEIGPTYVGVSPGGGGKVWNGVVADSRLPEGGDDDEITFSGESLVNSLGDRTTVSFTMGPVAGGNQGAGSSPTASEALYHDWVLVGYFSEFVGTADFTIGGLGTNEVADLYFYHRGDFPGTYLFGGAPRLPEPFAGLGIFTSGRTLYFKEVPIVGGQIVGQFTEGTALLGIVSGLTVVMSPVMPPPGPLTIARSETGLVLAWPGKAALLSADLLGGPWTELPAASPYPVTPAGAQKFYRLKQ